MRSDLGVALVALGGVMLFVTTGMLVFGLRRLRRLRRLLP